MGENFHQNIDKLFHKMEQYVSSKTVVGDAIVLGNVTILPMVEVTVGVGSGTKEKKGEDTFDTGGLGARIIPSAVLVIADGNVQLINIKNQDAVNKLIDMAPGVVSKLNFGSMFGKKETPEPKEEVHFEETVIKEE